MGTKTKGMKEQKTAIVTGAYGVIGKAISLKLAQMGYRLMLCGRNEKKVDCGPERNPGNQC